MDEEQTEKVDNEAFDEAVDLSESESVDSPDEDEGEEEQSMMSNDEMVEGDVEQVMNRSFDEAIELSPSASSESGVMSQAAGNSPPVMPQQDESSSSDSDDDDDDDDDDQQDDSAPQGTMNEAGGGTAGVIEGGYDAKDYEDLDCSDEIKELFSYISRYTAHNIELEHSLKPFIPDFIPAVGDIDAFLKIPKPNGLVDDIGLTHLGEAALVQSDPTIIEMELRAMTKKADLHAQSVSSITDAQHNVPQIKKWIESVEELHTSKPATEVVYKHPMPDIEALMQVWPAKFEEELERTVSLFPTAVPFSKLDQFHCSSPVYTSLSWISRCLLLFVTKAALTSFGCSHFHQQIWIAHWMNMQGSFVLCLGSLAEIVRFHHFTCCSHSSQSSTKISTSTKTWR